MVFRTLSYISVLFLLVLSLFSCAGAPVIPVLPAENSEPEWLTSPPSDGQWYYGIGGSHTRDEAADRERALARARVDLASAIAVDVVAVLESSEIVLASGESRETLEQRVTQSVEQSLVNVQTVEGWYGSERGYWILIRMSREEWEAQRRNDRRVAVSVPTGLEEQGGFNISFLNELNRKELPLQLLPGGKNTPYEISMDWIVSDYPALDEAGGILFSGVRGVVSFRHYGLQLFSREYGPVKEGGLSREQARERAVFKVLELFREDESFAAGIAEQLDGQPEGKDSEP